jgi:hypothetical protein
MSTAPTITPLAPFLDHLFSTGEAQLAGPPEIDDRRQVESAIHRAFDEFRLGIAGPLIGFDANAAVAAALLTARACWFAVSRDEPPELVASQLMPLAAPTTAAEHLSIDLTLRYAVTVHRRAHAQNPKDPLAIRLAETLRRCPLTGALADVADSPNGDATLAGHRGLQLLYAERLAANFRLEWLPAEGQARDLVEMVVRKQGNPWPPEP